MGPSCCLTIYMDQSAPGDESSAKTLDQHATGAACFADRTGLARSRNHCAVRSRSVTAKHRFERYESAALRGVDRCEVGIADPRQGGMPRRIIGQNRFAKTFAASKGELDWPLLYQELDLFDAYQAKVAECDIEIAVVSRRLRATTATPMRPLALARHRDKAANAPSFDAPAALHAAHEGRPRSLRPSGGCG